MKEERRMAETKTVGKPYADRVGRAADRIYSLREEIQTLIGGAVLHREPEELEKNLREIRLLLEAASGRMLDAQRKAPERPPKKES